MNAESRQKRKYYMQKKLKFGCDENKKKKIGDDGMEGEK
jgi:hypothetical protein